MFDETTIRGIVEGAERAGAPASIAMKLEADLKEALLAYRRRMDRVNRHTEVLSVLRDCGYSVTVAAGELDMTREGVYKHLRTERKSTDTSSGVDTKAA